MAWEQKEVRTHKRKCPYCGNSENLTLMDKVPDNFEYGDYSMTPEITDEVGSDTLKWTIETLEEAEKLEISYEIHGKGEYSPSEAQLAL